MANYINQDMARDLYSDMAGPVSPYGEDGRISDVDFAHEIALGTDKAMTVASQARKLGESAIARFAELRAETFELQYFSPAVNNAINQGMAQARESVFSEDERTKQHERVDLYIDLMQRRHTIRSEIASLYEEHGEKELEADFERIHRRAIRESKEQMRTELAIDQPTYSPLRYASDPDLEHGTVLRKRLPETILVGMTSIATELLERHGVIPNTKSVWGKQPGRLDSLTKAISDHVSNNYNGTLGPVTIEEIPFSEEEKRAYILSGIAPREINAASLARLRVSVLHKSLSKAHKTFGQADVLMYVVFDEKNGDYVSCTKRMAGEWQANTEGVERDADSIDRATIIEAQAVAHPVNGGLPTLGK